MKPIKKLIGTGKTKKPEFQTTGYVEWDNTHGTYVTPPNEYPNGTKLELYAVFEPKVVRPSADIRWVESAFEDDKWILVVDGKAIAWAKPPGVFCIARRSEQWTDGDVRLAVEESLARNELYGYKLED